MNRIFRTIKSIFEPYSLDWVGELRDTIIDNYKDEEWFKNSFQPIEKLFTPEFRIFKNPKEEYNVAILLLTEDIKKALVKNYLLENGYIPKLCLKKRQLVFRDSYGDINYENWIKEANEFSKKREYNILNYIIKNAPKPLVETLKKINRIECLYNFDELDTELHEIIINIVDDVEFENNSLHTDVPCKEDNSVPNINPYEYERIIANNLCSLGWDAYPTSGSGDQGADVIAEKHGLKFVIQCKLYNQPVGNKAVQEVSSARDYYEAFGAVVITNNDYTKSARQLAESQNVWLIHDSSIEEWSSTIDKIVQDVDETVE